jgi:hypothetical protein
VPSDRGRHAAHQLVDAKGEAMDPFDAVFIALFPLIMTWIGFAVWASFDMDRVGRRGTYYLALIMVLPPIGLALWWKQRRRPIATVSLRSTVTPGGATTDR